MFEIIVGAIGVTCAFWVGTIFVNEWPMRYRYCLGVILILSTGVVIAGLTKQLGLTFFLLFFLAGYVSGLTFLPSKHG